MPHRVHQCWCHGVLLCQILSLTFDTTNSTCLRRRPGLFLVQCTPYLGGGGGGPLSKCWVPPSDGTPPQYLAVSGWLAFGPSMVHFFVS